jgi:hypothetical protein
MSRTKGLASFSANFEPQIASPLDARCIVGEAADLLLEATWLGNDGYDYSFVGMVVAVHGDSTPTNNGVYWLKAADYTSATNWVQLGTDSGSAVTISEVVELIDTEEVTGTDTELTDTLSNTPRTYSVVKLFLNGVAQNPTLDYTVSGVNITWLAGTGEAVDMDTDDQLLAQYTIEL